MAKTCSCGREGRSTTTQRTSPTTAITATAEIRMMRRRSTPSGSSYSSSESRSMSSSAAGGIAVSDSAGTFLSGGTTTGFLHFGHAPFLPPCLSGTLILWPQLPQGNSMRVDLSGTTTPLPHFGHLPFLPECFSSTLMSRRQFGQANLITIFPFSSLLAQEDCLWGHKVNPFFSP